MRITKPITIQTPGRDLGKTFLLTEMDCDRAERWANRLILALVRNGFPVSADLQQAGMAGLAGLLSDGMKMFGALRWEDAEPLLDEMFECVQFQEPLAPRRLLPTDIEEVRTRWFLRGEVLSLHMGFSLSAELSKLILALRSMASPDMETSPQPSEQ